MQGFLADDLLRGELQSTPIVLYDLVYLPTRGSWMDHLRDGCPQMGIPDGGHFGMERYDWYLCASVVSEYPMPNGIQPYFHVGLNLDDGTLFPDQRGQFVALLDFPRKEHIEERNVQIEALRATDTPFIELKGKYKISEIRRIYRQCAMYFLSFRESFGLPIVELQACGAKVFTPYADWCPSHWIKSDLRIPGAGRLPSNFVVYDNSKDFLISEIQRLRASFDPNAVRRQLLVDHPELYVGNTESLSDFIRALKAGDIHSASHKKHKTLIAMTS
jgi:hypothetical protein